MFGARALTRFLGIAKVCASELKEGVVREGQPRQLLVYTASLVDKLTSTAAGHRATSRGDSAATRTLYKALKKISLQLQDQHRVLYDCMQLALYILLSHLVIYIHGKQPISNKVRACVRVCACACAVCACACAVVRVRVFLL